MSRGGDRGNLDSVERDPAGLLQGASPETVHGASGRFETPRSRAAKLFAEELWDDENYRANLKARIKAGEADQQEMFFLRHKFGDPPKAKGDESMNEVQKHFEELRAGVAELLAEHPALARELANAVAKSKKARLAILATATPAALPAVNPVKDDEIL